ncbi:hypothetical protein D9757_013044 [Collybiopsis confluens]|uniref:Argonaute-like protein n=1 Tax=Collybiopsis confluens TaxID=2823264 RepID=A0A8H5GH27_9AGAR|nr:hypothetical protein D9757_013044 [Collybiopsis confluens]
MPPRPAQEGGPARGGRGRGRGSAPPRGGSPTVTGAGRGAQMAGRGGGQSSGLPAAHVVTVGVRRPPVGKAGNHIKVHTNALEASVPQSMIYHYDIGQSTFVFVAKPANDHVAILPEDKVLPQRLTMLLIKQLQLQPEFQPIGAYDGRKNLFMPHLINFGKGIDSRTYDIPMNGNSQPRDRPPKVYKIKVTKVNEINPEVLQQYIDGKKSQDEDVLTAFTALNVVIRAGPIQTQPFNSRSFFTNEGARDVGLGFQLWRGYFQSLRPSPGRLLINIDLSTGMFHKPGPLIDIALEILNQKNRNALYPSSGLPERALKVLDKFLKHVRVTVESASREAGSRALTIASVTRQGANEIVFQLRDGTSTNVADYFRRLSNRPLQHPQMICVKTTTGAIIPFERCTIIPGQLARKEVPPEVTKAMVEFSTMKPPQRKESIRQSIQVFNYGQSEYVRNFGLAVEEARFPMSLEARQLPPPKIEYGSGSSPKEKIIAPRDGQWNLRDKKFFKPEVIHRWVVVIFEREDRFRQQDAATLIRDFISACRNVGMEVYETDPIIEYASGQNNVHSVLRAAGGKCAKKHNKGPDMLLVILPEGGNDLYRAVKHFGDVTQGVVTQCLKAIKCRGAREQYWANVCLKVNPKLGGVNAIPDASARQVLSDPQNPTIVFGADVMHPAPGSEAPSFSAVVGSIDSRAVKYVPRISVQTSRLEIIADLGAMVKDIIATYFSYQEKVEKKSRALCSPKRLLFFRDGVSEGQFAQVLKEEVKAIKAVCVELKISPKITFIVVGKRHHYRFFPEHPDALGKEADKSQNCIAGTVVDTGITHPIEFDFYIQSHGGLLGTSRSAHYNVLHDVRLFHHTDIIRD